MTSSRVALLSLHTSPLAQPGTGDGGGMNVYVRALAAALVRAGVACDVLTRRDAPGLPAILETEPGFRVVRLPVGPAAPVDKNVLPEWTEAFVDAALAHVAGDDGGGYELLHANYWVSALVGHCLKHELDVPLVCTFHTLAAVKAGAGVVDDPACRLDAEKRIIGCTDLVLASTTEERAQLVELYDADPTRVEVVPPGVDHDVFRSMDAPWRAHERHALGLSGRRVMLFVGRVQPLKGLEVAVRALAASDDDDAVLVVVGGPSGSSGAAELARVKELVRTLGLSERVRFVDPQPHANLARFYRAADVCLVPSRTESFGLVALEAAACGVPVVAADVGGLRGVVSNGETGLLVPGRDPAAYAAAVRLLRDSPELASRLGATAESRSRRYGWTMTAARLRRLYGDLLARELVSCG